MSIDLTKQTLASKGINDSTISGATIKDALETLDAAIGAIGGGGGGGGGAKIFMLPFNKTTLPAFTTDDVPNGFLVTNIVVDVQVALTGGPLEIKVDGATDLILALENDANSFASTVGIYRIAVWDKIVGASNVGKLYCSATGGGFAGSGVIYLEGVIPNV